jgi:peptidyl-prolyl cis-trans isomerase C
VKLIGLIMLCILWSGCPRPIAGSSSPSRGFQFESNQDDSDVYAKVGKSQVTVAQLQKLINKQSPYVRAQYEKDPESLDKFIEGQIRYALLAEKGMALGYDRDPEVRDASKKLIVQKLTRDVFDNQVKLSEVTKVEIENFYKEHIDDYQKPEMIRLGHILIGFGADKEKARQQINALIPQVKAPEKLASRAHFRGLVKEHSQEESSKNTGGDMRYRSKRELENLLGGTATKQAWALSAVNDVSEVVESKIGFHIFKKLGERPPTNRQLTEVRAQVKNRVYRQKRKSAFNQYLETLKTEIGVQMNLEAKKKLYFDAPAKKDPHGHLSHGNPSRKTR